MSNQYINRVNGIHIQDTELKNNVIEKTNTKEYTPTGDYNPATKKYVDDKTEILPVKNNYVIFEDAVPTPKTSETSTYGAVDVKQYAFDNLQNEDMISSAIKYNLSITFNDGTNDITKDLILENIYNGNAYYVDEDISLSLDYIEKEHSICIAVNKEPDLSPCDILKATARYDCYVNLLQNYHIQSIDYNKIESIPTTLENLRRGSLHALQDIKYYNLHDNMFIWDGNKINERLDESSGVKQNEFVSDTSTGGYSIKVKQKDGEGIGFGQHISINNSDHIVISAGIGEDVIIKVYNSDTKELIDTLNYTDAYGYNMLTIDKYYLNGVNNIFIAFTVKDSIQNFYNNAYIMDIVVYYQKSFLRKNEILTKTNTKEYIPTGDYNPATKKYVDDKISSSTAGTIDETDLDTILTDIYGFTDTTK